MAALRALGARIVTCDAVRHAPPVRPGSRLLDRRDVVTILALMAIGMGLRLAYYSGFGLDDDPIFRGNIAAVLDGTLTHDNVSYRLAWLLPSALSCRIFGLTELGMILPIVVTATLSIGLVYAHGKLLWDRVGALTATLLLITFPLDFAWSTMLANDVVVSFFSGLAMLFVLRALRRAQRRARWRTWAIAAVTLWVATQAKLSGVFVIPAIAAVCWTERGRLDASVVAFIVPATVLFLATGLAYYHFAGDPLAPVHAEMELQGLTPAGALVHRVTAESMLEYPQWLFTGDRWGDWPFSFYPYALVLLALVGLATSSRQAVIPVLWLLAVLLCLEMNIQRVAGMWVCGFRNVRHCHVLVYPLTLALTGYLVGVRARWPRLAHAVTAALLVVGLWHSVAIASKTHAAFGDMRAVCRYMRTLPPGHVLSDAQLPPTWCPFMEAANGWTFELLSMLDVSARRVKIATVETGYVVTGGGREPHYGCYDCIIRAAELPQGRWSLVHEFPGPAEPTTWRPEPLRVWKTDIPEAPTPAGR